MSVSLEEALNDAGYDFENPADANWLLSNKEEFDELIDKAEEISNLYDEYKIFISEEEDLDHWNYPSFEEYRKLSEEYCKSKSPLEFIEWYEAKENK